jgi:hypothetical protein
MTDVQDLPHTHVVRRAIEADSRAAADLLFLERWEMTPQHSVGAVLRIAQIRRANPSLAEEVRAELAGGARRR